MLQRPWFAWFLSNVAAVICLLVWGARAWPAQIPEVFKSACFAALQGVALMGGSRLGMMWADRTRLQLTFVPVCLLLGTLGIANVLFTTTPDVALPWLVTCSLIVAVGQASMFIALLEPAARDGAAPADLGDALALQVAAAVFAGCLYHLAPLAGWPTLWLVEAAAALWAAAAALYAWAHKTTSQGPALHTATVSLASLFRHRRWPLLAVTAMCGGLAACTPTLWVQSLECVSGLSMVKGAAPMLMLAGYGIGAKVAAAAAQRPATVRLALAITLLGCAGFFLLGMVHFDTLPQRLQGLTRISDDQSWRRITLELLLTAAVVLPGSVGTGACLPLVAGAVGNGAPAAAQTLRRVLLAYGAGMVGGAALVPMLAQYVGLEATMRAAALLYTFAALVSSSAATLQRKVVHGLDAAALATALVIAVWPRWTVHNVEWSNFRETRPREDRDGLQYGPGLDNMRSHARKPALPEDQGSS